MQKISAIIDTQKISHKNIGRINAGDDTVLELEIRMNDEPLQFNNPVFTYIYKKSDGNYGRQERDITIVDGKVVIRLEEQAVTCTGIVSGQLFIVDNGKTSTCIFNFQVGKSFDREIIQSISNVEVLKELDEYVATAFENLTEYEERLAIGDESVRKLNTDMIKAESDRNKNETSRVEAEKIRETEFNNIKEDNIKFKDEINVSINELSKDFDEVVANVTNGSESATNSEIVQARAGEVNLNKRLDKFSASLDTKASKNEIFSMANMGQDVKEAMTGGSVAVVGKNAILNENIVNKQVSLRKTDFISYSDNYFNPNTVSVGSLTSTGELDTNGNMVTCDYTLCDKLINYYCSANYPTYPICFYDVNKTLLQYYPNTRWDLKRKVPSNAYYFRASTQLATKNDFTLIFKDTQITSDVEKIAYIENKIDNNIKVSYENADTNLKLKIDKANVLDTVFVDSFKSLYEFNRDNFYGAIPSADLTFDGNFPPSFTFNGTTTSGILIRGKSSTLSSLSKGDVYVYIDFELIGCSFDSVDMYFSCEVDTNSVKFSLTNNNRNKMVKKYNITQDFSNTRWKIYLSNFSNSTKTGTLKINSIQIIKLPDSSYSENDILSTIDKIGLNNSSINSNILFAENSLHSSVADKISSKWAGKKFVTFGHSNVAQNKWQTQVADYFGMTHVNLGIGGSSIGDYSSLGVVGDPTPMVSDSRINKIPIDTDLIILVCGQNDHKRVNNEWLNTIGQWGDSTVTTVYGAYQIMLQKIYARCPNVKIIITNDIFRINQMGDGGNERMENMRIAIEKIANKNSLPLLNTYQLLGYNNFNYTTGYVDGVHFNDNGGNRMADIVIGFMKSIEPIN